MKPFELTEPNEVASREETEANLKRWREALAVVEQEAASLREWLSRPTVNAQGKADRERALTGAESRINWLRSKVEQIEERM